MTSTDLVTTLDIPHSKVKTFFFNRTMEYPEEEAKKFCKENCMIYLGSKIAESYTLHTWQHYQKQVFTVQCTSKTPRLFYEYGKL